MFLSKEYLKTNIFIVLRLENSKIIEKNEKIDVLTCIYHIYKSNCFVSKISYFAYERHALKNNRFWAREQLFSVNN